MELEYEEDGELDNHMKNSEAIAYSPEMFSKMPEYEKFDGEGLFV